MNPLYYLKMATKIDYAGMHRMIGEIKERSGQGRIHTFIDMVRCGFKFQAGFTDYYMLHFEDLTDEQRATYVTRGVNEAYIRALNDRAYYHIFENKIEFNEHFADFVKRDWIDLNRTSKEEFAEFLAKHPVVMAKVVEGTWGLGIDKVEVTPETDTDALYDRLIENKQFLVEEYMVQHPLMASLNPSSVNTLRVVTVNKNDNVNIVTRAIRIGGGKNNVDNLDNGGVFTMFDEDGIITKPAIDHDSHVFEEHPVTGVHFVGFQIPFAHEALEMAVRAARVVPQVGITGFDVAIGPDGPQLIEGNQIPGYILAQSKIHVTENGEGAKPLYDAAIYGESN